MGAPPQVTQHIVEALLDTHAKAARNRRLMLVHGRYAPGAPTEFTAKTGDRRKVKVSDQTSVLGIVDQWQRHPDETAESGTMLVITTDVDETQLGWDLRGHAVRRGILPVESAEIVKQRFGAAYLDPRIYRAPWLLQALLDAEPHGGWPRTGTVLTFDAAMRALAVARLGLGEAHSEAAVDADTLLAWSRTSAGPARFAQLGEAERRELKRWLGESAGGAVGVLLSLAEAGRGSDAMALGLLGSVLADPAAPADAVLAVGGLFGQAAPRGGDVKTYTEAVEGTLTRWRRGHRAAAVAAGRAELGGHLHRLAPQTVLRRAGGRRRQGEMERTRLRVRLLARADARDARGAAGGRPAGEAHAAGERLPGRGARSAGGDRAPGRHRHRPHTDLPALVDVGRAPGQRHARGHPRRGRRARPASQRLLAATAGRPHPAEVEAGDGRDTGTPVSAGRRRAGRHRA